MKSFQELGYRSDASNQQRVELNSAQVIFRESKTVDRETDARSTNESASVFSEGRA